MAETLVHEFQHVKLGGLMDMVRLVEVGRGAGLCAWRQDPRPAGGLLQGAYAHLGIVRFWRAQQHAEPTRTKSCGPRRCSPLAVSDRPCRSYDGGHRRLTGRATVARPAPRSGTGLESDPLTGGAQEIAEEAAMDHWLTWQMRHMAFDPPQWNVSPPLIRG